MHPPGPLSRLKTLLLKGRGKEEEEGMEGGERGGKEREGERKWYPSYPHFLGESYVPGRNISSDCENSDDQKGYAMERE